MELKQSVFCRIRINSSGLQQLSHLIRCLRRMVVSRPRRLILCGKTELDHGGIWSGFDTTLRAHYDGIGLQSSWPVLPKHWNCQHESYCSYSLHCALPTIVLGTVRVEKTCGKIRASIQEIAAIF